MSCVIMAVTSNRCFAGAWTSQEGKLYEKLSLNNYTTDRYFDNDGKKSNLSYNGKFSDINISNYLEYGLTDSIGVINSIFVKRIENKTDFATTTTSGIGDIEIGLKHKLAEGSYGVLSHQAMVKIPGLYDKKSALPLGNGQFDAEYRILYGLSLWRIFPGYANFEAGYRYRAEAPSDEFRYLLEIGADITSKLYVRAKLDGIQSVNNSDKMSDSVGNPTTIYQFDLGKLDTALGYKIGEMWGAELGYTPTLYGKNTADGTTFSLGVTYSIR
ncbi:MAG: hypothetical protein HQK85_11515 [Nitrospinae bacterium]|nr:hypothetical protein [Nitrospinota bacterium]